VRDYTDARRHDVPLTLWQVAPEFNRCSAIPLHAKTMFVSRAINSCCSAGRTSASNAAITVAGRGSCPGPLIIDHRHFSTSTR